MPVPRTLLPLLACLLRKTSRLEVGKCMPRRGCARLCSRLSGHFLRVTEVLGVESFVITYLLVLESSHFVRAHRERQSRAFILKASGLFVLQLAKGAR